jgi:hypothetical protein
LKAFPKDVKLSCNKDPLLCHGHATCFTDYTPHHSNISLDLILVGSTKWTKSSPKADGDHQGRAPEDLESRPCYVSQRGNEDGEIYFQVTIPDDVEFNKVLICGYKIANHKEGIFGHVEYKIDLNVSPLGEAMGAAGGSLGGGKMRNKREDYVPSDKRVIWTSHQMVSAYCHLLKDLPPGTHVIGLEAKEKKPTGLSHVITWGHW